jgi:general secretion pathway protein K
MIEKSDLKLPCIATGPALGQSPGSARPKGLALVMVLFILVLMTVSVTWLSEEILLSLRRAENARDSEQAWQMLIGSEAWALSVLSRDILESETDHPGEAWKNLGQGVEIEHGQLLTVIDDLQGRLNINNLIDETSVVQPQAGNNFNTNVWTQAFRRLLISLELDPGLSDAVLDWLDSDQNVRGASGAEDADYLGKDPPYRTANRRFSEVSELLLVEGFDKAIVEKLAPYISVLPTSRVLININTAPAGLLRILGKDVLSVESGETLVNDRPAENGYTVEEFLQHDMMAGEQDIAKPLIDNKSRYFLIRSDTKFGRARMKLNSFVERKDGKTTVIKRAPVL